MDVLFEPVKIGVMIIKQELRTYLNNRLYHLNETSSIDASREIVRLLNGTASYKIDNNESLAHNLDTMANVFRELATKIRSDASIKE